MDQEHFREISEAFDEAAGLPPSERARILGARFADHPERRAEVEALLAEHDRMDAPVATARGLEALALESSLGFEAAAPQVFSEGLPTLKGAYRLLRTIGQGGMGVVYEAEQSFPRRRVALKSIRPGFASPTMLRRFKTEVELLARLHHPGIAQIHEAGFADSSSKSHAFFVMELVDGLPLHRYARDHKLSLQEKLTLLTKICDAVQHAHQRGVIHRDLKPANILVTAAGQPKILDFGVARAADDTGDGTLATHAGQVLGTPSYMSPEQISGESVDTRTDVYALGVIAYELLAGKLPLDLSNKSIPEAIRALREHGVPPISNGNPELRGDVEIIVATAIHPDRDRRYASAAELAEDLRRFLDHRPIGARRDSASYVLGKLARRHWAIVTLGAGLLLALVAFGVLSSVMAARNGRLAWESKQAQSKAELESERSRALSRTLEQELSSARVGRARADASAGQLKLAEETMWDEYLANPHSLNAKWGLRELYARIPCEWTARGETSMSTSAISMDGSVITVAEARGRIVARSAKDGSITYRGPELGSTVTALCVSADNMSAYAGLADGRLMQVELKEGGALTVMGGAPAHPGGVRSLAMNGNGHRLAAGGSDKRISLWDTTSATMIDAWVAHNDAVRTLTMSEDGLQIASIGTSADSARMLWKLGVERTSVELPLHGLYLSTLEFMPGGQTLAAGLGIFGTGEPGYCVGMLDLRTLSLTTTVGGLGGPVQRIKPSPDGSRFAIAAGQSLYLYDRTGGSQLRSLGQQQGFLTSCGWAEDDRIISVSIPPSGIAEIRRFEARIEPTLTRLTGFESWCFSAAWSADSRLLAFDAGGAGVAIHDVPTLERAAFVPTPGASRTRALQFIGNSSRLLAASADGQLRLIDADEGRLLKEFGPKRSECYSLAVLEDGKTVFSGHGDAIIRVWDIERGEIIRELPKLERRVETMALSRNANVLVTSGLGAAVNLVNTEALEPLGRIATSAMPWGVAISPDERTLLVTTYAGTIDVIDMEARARKTTLQAHQRLVPGVAFSPDGSLFATGAEDSTVRLWDSATLRQVWTMDTKSAEVVSVAFDPQCRFLSAASAGRTLIIYDLYALDRYVQGNRAVQEARFKAK